MKTIRSLMTLAGLFLVLFALSATGAKAQNLSSASFSGNFTLPVAAQWGEMTLPAGNYTLGVGLAVGDTEWLWRRPALAALRVFPRGGAPTPTPGREAGQVVVAPLVDGHEDDEPRGLGLCRRGCGRHGSRQ